MLYMGHLWFNGLDQVGLIDGPLLHPLSDGCHLETSINLLVRKFCYGWGWDLVNKSTNWLWKDTWGSCMTPATTCYRIKWQSTSIFSVISWKTGMLAICVALVLSALRLVGPRTWTPSSWRSRRSQITSLLVDDIGLYLASMVDLETVTCYISKK